MKKNKVFDIPFIGYDYGKDNQWEFDVYPITMNPFLVQKEEFNIEKMEFLCNLIFLIWQGADASMTTTQKSIIDNALLSYYHQYYNIDENWYASKTNEELLLYLAKYNIDEENVRNHVENQFKESQTYYDILEVSYNASIEEIKAKGREMIKKVFEAYETLTDVEKRKVYNETHLIVATAPMIVKRPETKEEYDKIFRKTIIKQIVEVEKSFSTQELSFNSFYEYCEKFLPIYLNNKKHKINEDEFNLRTFLLVLKDFYKGGRYEKTLNKNDIHIFPKQFKNRILINKDEKK